jgi:hypothetical protein
LKKKLEFEEELELEEEAIALKKRAKETREKIARRELK